MFCLFLTFAETPAKLPPCDGLVHTAAKAADPYLDDGAPPAQVVQAYFDTVPDLEKFAAEHASLRCSAQAMLVRRFRVPEPRAGRYTYLVAYEGPAPDENAWLAHYLAHHPPIMARLPGIRQLEVYTRVDWISPAGWVRESCMQRNKVAFDSEEALNAALGSPIRKEMRADYAKLPAFSGRVTHYPMTTANL